MSNIEYLQKIRSNYTEEPTTKLDELKELNQKVNRPANVFAYTFGTISSLVLGTGMSFALGAIGATLSFSMPLGIGVGVVGLIGTLLTYPIYKKILKSRKNKHREKILELTNELLGIKKEEN